MTSVLRMRLTPRAVGVFAIVAALGGGLGALAGAALAALVMFVWNGGFGGHLAGAAYLFGAAIGAGHGVVLGSILAWTLLRHVALWRVITEAACGAAAGAVIGVVAFEEPSSTVVLILAPALGATLAAIRLRFASPPLVLADSRAAR